MPMLRVRRDERDVARRHLMALVVGRDQTLALGDDQDLIGRVLVRLVDGTVLEVHLREAQVAALLAHGGLVVDLSDEYRVLRPLASGLGHPYDAHPSILAQTGVT